MSAQQKMSGKRVLVTGSGTGIGREIALEFARNGADVAVHYSHADEGAQSAVMEMRGMGVRAQARSNSPIRVSGSMPLLRAG